MNVPRFNRWKPAVIFKQWLRLFFDSAQLNIGMEYGHIFPFHVFWCITMYPGIIFVNIGDKTLSIRYTGSIQTVIRNRFKSFDFHLSSLSFCDILYIFDDFDNLSLAVFNGESRSFCPNLLPIFCRKLNLLSLDFSGSETLNNRTIWARGRPFLIDFVAFFTHKGFFFVMRFFYPFIILDDAHIRIQNADPVLYGIIDFL